MDTPVFKLEGVVKSKNDISDFEGPLSLILLLLSRNRIEIRDISISLILEQYLQYLGEMSELDLDIASEFVAMASHLAYIKTKMLLTGEEEVESEIEQLISSLEKLQQGDRYLQIKEAAQTLSGMYLRGASMMAGPPEPLSDEPLAYAHQSGDLLKAMQNLINREDALIKSMNTREVLYPEKSVYSIPEKISQLLDALKREKQINLQSLILSSESRTELIATFIAILELCRVGSVLLSDDKEDITISYTGSSREFPVIDYSDDEWVS